MAEILTCSPAMSSVAASRALGAAEARYVVDFPALEIAAGTRVPNFRFRRFDHSVKCLKLAAVGQG